MDDRGQSHPAVEPPTERRLLTGLPRRARLKKEFVVRHVKEIVRKNPPPEPAGAEPGVPAHRNGDSVHLMVAFNPTCRDAETEISSWRLDGMFGAEAAGHRLRCRYRKKSTQERFGAALAVASDVAALNRIRRTVENGRMPATA